ncbi:hypothetical protein PUN28_015946 [Cardiocondyla obscurior]|uniref:Uncharacterized protein n=1 Tax=Cardiocondyla obscurior TaxID=286306 RepID=A0AAW2EUH2_9HYME
MATDYLSEFRGRSALRFVQQRRRCPLLNVCLFRNPFAVAQTTLLHVVESPVENGASTYDNAHREIVDRKKSKKGEKRERENSVTGLTGVVHTPAPSLPALPSAPVEGPKTEALNLLV